MAAQGRFKSKATSLANSISNFCEHQPPGTNGGPVGIKRRKTRSDEVYVDKVGAISFTWQKLKREGSFSCSVRPGDDKDSILAGHQSPLHCLLPSAFLPSDL